MGKELFDNIPGPLSRGVPEGLHRRLDEHPRVQLRALPHREVLVQDAPVLTNQLITKLILMATISLFYTDSTESEVEKQFAGLRDVKDAEEFVPYLESVKLGRQQIPS